MPTLPTPPPHPTSVFLELFYDQSRTAPSHPRQIGQTGQVLGTLGPGSTGEQALMGRAERGYMGEATYKTWIQNYLFVQFRRDWAPPVNLFPCPEGALEPPAHCGVQKGGSGEVSDTVRSLARSSFQVLSPELASVLSTPWE